MPDMSTISARHKTLHNKQILLNRGFGHRRSAVIAATVALLVSLSLLTPECSAQDVEPTRKSVIRGYPTTATKAQKQQVIDAFTSMVQSRDGVLRVKGKFAARITPVRNLKAKPAQFHSGSFSIDFVSGYVRVAAFVGQLVANTSDEDSSSKESKQDYGEQVESLQVEKQTVEALYAKPDVNEARLVPLDDIGKLFRVHTFRPRNGGLFMRGEEFCAHRQLNVRHAEVHHPNSEEPSWLHYPDPRVVGLAHRREFKLPNPFATTLHRHTIAKPFDFQTVRHPSSFENLQRLTLLFDNRFRRLFLDPSKGSLPLFTIDCPLKRRDEFNAVLIEKFAGRSTTEAVNVNDVWLPEKHRYVDEGGIIEYQFEWTMANDEFSEDEFELRKFDIEGLRYVVDHRSGNPERLNLGSFDNSSQSNSFSD